MRRRARPRSRPSPKCSPCAWDERHSRRCWKASPRWRSRCCGRWRRACESRLPRQWTDAEAAMRALTPVARAVRLVGRSRRLTWAEAAWAAYITAEQGLEIALVVFAYGHGGIAAAGLLAAPRSGAPPGAAPFTAGPRGPRGP